MGIASIKTENLCPSGRHVMDPGWTKCPYCEGERKSKEQTAFQEPIFSTASDRGTKIIEETTSSSDNRPTRQMPQSPQGQKLGGYGGRGDTRRITGILITYTWHPQGDLYPIREGKNYIGADVVTHEPGSPSCDILVSDDDKLSSAHALILCRQGNFQIKDLESTNGTFIDEKMIPMEGTELSDTATLRTGTTVWTFMRVLSSDKVVSQPIKVHKTSEPTVEEPKPSGYDTVLPR